MECEAPIWTPKPWGDEWLMKVTDTYAVKVLHLRRGCRTSLQYHRVKRETLLPGCGKVDLELHRDGVVQMRTLCAAVELPPGTIHRLIGVCDSDVVEVSSTELDDVVRLEDDYGRAEERAGGVV